VVARADGAIRYGSSSNTGSTRSSRGCTLLALIAGSRRCIERRLVDVMRTRLAHASAVVRDPQLPVRFPGAKGCNERGVLVIPGTACADGIDGDVVSMAPPFIIGETEIELIVAALRGAIEDVGRDVLQ
jgi:hypothetical protein